MKKRTAKKIMSLMFALTLCVSAFIPANAQSPEEETVETVTETVLITPDGLIQPTATTTEEQVWGNCVKIKFSFERYTSSGYKYVRNGTIVSVKGYGIWGFALGSSSVNRVAGGSAYDVRLDGVRVLPGSLSTERVYPHFYFQ